MVAELFMICAGFNSLTIWRCTNVQTVMGI